MKIVVKEKEWLYGTGLCHGRLLDSNGKKDVLYFLGRKCGVPKQWMEQVADPAFTASDKWPKKIVKIVKTKRSDRFVNTKLCHKIMEVNDDPTLPLKKRKKVLQKLFSLLGVELVFKK